MKSGKPQLNDLNLHRSVNMALEQSDEEYVPVCDYDSKDEEYVPQSMKRKSQKPKAKRKRKRRIIEDADDDLKMDQNDNKPLKRRKNKKRNRTEFENSFDAESNAINFKNIENESESMIQYELELIQMAEIAEQEYKTKKEKEEKSANKCQEPKCNSLTICPLYFKHFGISVCRECKWKPKYKCLSKTNSKKEYLLSEGDLNSLRCWVKDIKRPINVSMESSDGQWIPKYMKLYLKYQLEELAIEKWESMQGIEAERNRREINRMQRSIAQSRKKRKVEFECLDDIVVDDAVIEEHEAKHVHTFGESECVNEEFDEWQKECTECGYIEKWEEF